MSEVASCPVPDKAEWQKSVDGQTFKCIDVRETKYHGSCLNPESPSLEINPISFDDKQHYRLWVWNKIGEQGSNTVFLNVIGSMYEFLVFKIICKSNQTSASFKI